MSPSQAKIRTIDHREYPLWSDVYEAVEVAMPYHRQTREARKKRSWLFRGQSNADWSLTPTLFRGKPDQNQIDQRIKRTQDFICALKQNVCSLGLSRLTDDQLVAVAQHYGLPTNLLDFTYNLEVAAYFASDPDSNSDIGVIYCISRDRYEELSEYLPPIISDDLIEIPRIYNQEGVFIQCSPKVAADLMEECIDRFYFVQDHKKAYRGGVFLNSSMLPQREDCDSEATYQAMIRTLRSERPDLFERSPQIGGWRVFPAEDQIAQLAEKHSDIVIRTPRKKAPDPQPQSGFWHDLLANIQSGRLVQTRSLPGRVRYSDELAAITRKVSPYNRNQIESSWAQVANMIIYDYMFPAFEDGYSPKWIATLCEQLVAAWSLNFVMHAESFLKQYPLTPKSWVPFAARLWNMDADKITEFDFETARPNRIYFRSALPLETVTLILRRALPILADKLSLRPAVVADLGSLNDEEILAGPYIQLTGAIADQFLSFLDEEERMELWFSKVVPVGTIFILGNNRPFLNPDEVYRCGFP